MIFAPLKYLSFKILSKLPFNSKHHYHINLLAQETLANLKKRITQSSLVESRVKVDLSTQHLKSGESLTDVLAKYGRPVFIKSHKSSGIVHDVILYKRMIQGQKSKIVYNFINGEVAAIEFHIKIESASQYEKVSNFVKKKYLENGPLHNLQCLIDPNGNKLYFENTFDISLTFVNNNPEIIQNINAALFQEKYTYNRYTERSDFQLQM